MPFFFLLHPSVATWRRFDSRYAGLERRFGICLTKNRQFNTSMTVQIDSYGDSELIIVLLKKICGQKLCCLEMSARLKRFTAVTHF